MVTKTNKVHPLMGMAITIKHPLNEIGETEMYLSKCLSTNKYMFAIPLHNWNYTKEESNPIDLQFAPGPFNRLPYKNGLIADMLYAIDLLEKQIVNL
jgi:hypothetical protein